MLFRNKTLSNTLVVSYVFASLLVYNLSQAGGYEKLSEQLPEDEEFGKGLEDYACTPEAIAKIEKVEKEYLKLIRISRPTLELKHEFIHYVLDKFESESRWTAGEKKSGIYKRAINCQTPSGRTVLSMVVNVIYGCRSSYLYDNSYLASILRLIRLGADPYSHPEIGRFFMDTYDSRLFITSYGEEIRPSALFTTLFGRNFKPDNAWHIDYIEYIFRIRQLFNINDYDEINFENLFKSWYNKIPIDSWSSPTDEMTRALDRFLKIYLSQDSNWDWPAGSIDHLKRFIERRGGKTYLKEAITSVIKDGRRVPENIFHSLTIFEYSKAELDIDVEQFLHLFGKASVATRLMQLVSAVRIVDRWNEVRRSSYPIWFAHYSLQENAEFRQRISADLLKALIENKDRWQGIDPKAIARDLITSMQSKKERFRLPFIRLQDGREVRYCQAALQYGFPLAINEDDSIADWNYASQRERLETIHQLLTMFKLPELKQFLIRSYSAQAIAKSISPFKGEQGISLRLKALSEGRVDLFSRLDTEFPEGERGIFAKSGISIHVNGPAAAGAGSSEVAPFVYPLTFFELMLFHTTQSRSLVPLLESASTIPDNETLKKMAAFVIATASPDNMDIARAFRKKFPEIFKGDAPAFSNSIPFLNANWILDVDGESSDSLAERILINSFWSKFNKPDITSQPELKVLDFALLNGKPCLLRFWLGRDLDLNAMSSRIIQLGIKASSDKYQILVNQMQDIQFEPSPRMGPQSTPQSTPQFTIDTSNPAASPKDASSATPVLLSPIGDPVSSPATSVISDGQAAATHSAAVGEDPSDPSAMSTDQATQKLKAILFPYTTTVQETLIGFERGSFLYGSAPGDKDHLSNNIVPKKYFSVDAFRMSKYQESQKQFREVMGEEKWLEHKTRILAYIQQESFEDSFIGDDLPIFYLTRDEEDEYISKKNAIVKQLWSFLGMEGDAPHFRKPTEIEAEYVRNKLLESPEMVAMSMDGGARMVRVTSQQTPFTGTDSSAGLPRPKEWSSGPYEVYSSELTEVNGLVGLVRNLSEITSTPYDGDRIDPKLNNGAFSAIRGGSCWNNKAHEECRLGYRSYVGEQTRSRELGLRLATY